MKYRIFQWDIERQEWVQRLGTNSKDTYDFCSSAFRLAYPNANFQFIEPPPEAVQQGEDAQEA